MHTFFVEVYDEMAKDGFAKEYELLKVGELIALFFNYEKLNRSVEMVVQQMKLHHQYLTVDLEIAVAHLMSERTDSWDDKTRAARAIGNALKQAEIYFNYCLIAAEMLKEIGYTRDGDEFQSQLFRTKRNIK